MSTDPTFDLMSTTELMSTADHRLTTLIPPGTTDEPEMDGKDPYINAGAVNLLRAVMRYAPNERGQRKVAGEIASAATRIALYELAYQYRFNMLYPMKSKGGKTPAPSALSHPSRLSGDADYAMVREGLVAAPREGKCKDNVLRRDGYACVVTRMQDQGHPDKPALGRGRTPTNACHIIPYSIIGEDKAKLDGKASVISMLSRFSGGEAVERLGLNGQAINRLGNMLTLQPTLHTMFGEFNLWFEPVPDKGRRYRVRTGFEYTYVEDGTEVDLISHAEGLEAPVPLFLDIHRAVGNIIRECSMCEDIVNWSRDYETTKTLSGDASGNSFEILSIALAPMSWSISVGA